MSSLIELNNISWNRINLLISFGTSVIVPEYILKHKNLTAINLHTGLPEYPGRDIHHFVIYYGEKEHGATLHQMTKNVDEGRIIYVKKFKILNSHTPFNLLNLSNEYGIELVIKFIRYFLKNKKIPKTTNRFWGKYKFSRKKFLDLCFIENGITNTEFKRRLKSLQMSGFKNIYTIIHNQKFYL